MNDLGYNPCPKCKSSVIDFGCGEGTNRGMVYAECEGCGYIRWVPVHEDTWHNLRLADIIRISRQAWNDRKWEDEE